MLSTLGLVREVIEHKWLTSSIERAQKRVEGHNFDIRTINLIILLINREILSVPRETIINENIFNFIETEMNLYQIY